MTFCSRKLRISQFLQTIVCSVSEMDKAHLTFVCLTELADLPLIRLDFSCNKITEIPLAYRKLRQLQHIILDNNPMQSPPAQVSIESEKSQFLFLWRPK